MEWDITGLKGTFKMGAMADVTFDAVEEFTPPSVDDLLVSLVRVIIRCRSTSSGNAEPYARRKGRHMPRGKKGRHL